MNNQQAFTLIELMIVVAIIGILASIAYPSYQDSVMRSRRADVQGVLVGYANTLERSFTVNNTYVGAPVLPATDYYTLTASITASSYTLTAQPIGAQTTDICGMLTLTDKGEKSATSKGCW